MQENPGLHLSAACQKCVCGHKASLKIITKKIVTLPARKWSLTAQPQCQLPVSRTYHHSSNSMSRLWTTELFTRIMTQGWRRPAYRKASQDFFDFTQRELTLIVYSQFFIGG
jgi:hypothetical protein